MFIYTNNSTAGKELVRSVPFTIAGKKKTRYLGINLIKNVRDLHHENCKTLKKETEEENKQKKGKKSCMFMNW